MRIFTKTAFAVPLLAVTATLSINAFAQCAVDGNLKAVRDQIISQRFPALANSPPQILVCTGSQFPPGVAGVWDGTAIRVPDWSTRHDQNLATNVPTSWPTPVRGSSSSRVPNKLKAIEP